jgi:hypothetical protein
MSVERSEQAGALPLMAEADEIARMELLCRPHQRAPARRVEALDERRLDARAQLAAQAPTGKARVDDAGVVDDQRVAGRKKERKVADDLVLEDARRRDDEQARLVARLDRAQRDPFRREFEIEKIDAHVRVAVCPRRDASPASAGEGAARSGKIRRRASP